MNDSSIWAYDVGLTMSAVSQLSCIIIVARQIILRPSWRARVHWTAFLALVYFIVLCAFSRLAVAAILTTLIFRTIMALQDWRRALPVAAGGQNLHFSCTDRLLSKQLGACVREPVLKWMTVALVTMLVVVAIGEPRDSVLTPEIMKFLLATTSNVSAWWLAAGVLMLSVSVLLEQTECSIQNFCHAASFAAVIFCGLLLLSSEPAFSTLAVFLMFLSIIYLSAIKFRRTATHLHACDFIYWCRNYSDIAFWLKNERADALKLILTIISAIVLLVVVGLSEPSVVDRWIVGLLFLLSIAVAGIARHFWPLRIDWAVYQRPVIPIALFIEAISEAFHAHRRGVLKTVAAARPPEFANLIVPTLECSRPTIILILNESTFPPSLYVPSDNDPLLADFFQSTDAQTRGLRVEIFGGLTWKTEFSVLTGIPVSSYGPFGTHVFHWATGRIHHSLPQYLRNYGYRTGAILPSLKTLARGDRFYPSIGFDEISDRSTIGASDDRQSDAFYLNCALDWLGAHFAGGGGAAFLYVLTMSNHAPHDVQIIEEGRSRPSTALSGDEFSEYMRRLRQTCRDYFHFRAELARRFPDREFLIVHFGDHQPPFTARLRGGDKTRGTTLDESVNFIRNGRAFSHEEVGYMTYFAIDGVNFKPVIDPSLPESIEAAYLSTLTLMAGGIPLDGLHSFRYELMKRHDGRLFLADKDGKIAAQLNHQMMECGFISKH